MEGGSVYLLLLRVALQAPALHSLRRLVDVLAAAAEHHREGHPGTPPEKAIALQPTPGLRFEPFQPGRQVQGLL